MLRFSPEGGRALLSRRTKKHMTLLRTAVAVAAPQVVHEQSAAKEEALRADVRYWLVGLAILGVAYALLHNDKLVSGPDTSYYISVARNVALGKGYVFNGAVVGRAPPLWPAVLAMGMKVSASFGFLNWLPMIFLLGGMSVWYWVLRRLADGRWSLTAMVLAGILFFTYTASMQLRTEALFSLVFSLAVLVAMQIAEGKRLWWRAAVLIVLCMVMVSVRWAGMAAWVVVGAALVSGKRPIRMSQLVVASLSLLATIGTFGMTRLVLLNLPQPERTWQIEVGKRGPKIPDEDTEGTVKMQTLLSKKGITGTSLSILNSGKWMSSVMWMPMYMGIAHNAVGIVTNIIGWGLILLCALTAWRDGKVGQWIWVGAFLYCAAMAFRMRVPNPRYLVPVAPLLVLGIMRGLEHLRDAQSPWRGLWKFLLGAFVVSVLLVNGVLWGIDVWINHSSNFYGRYRAGETEKLIQSGDYMRERGVKDGQIAVSVFYLNLGRQRPNGEGLRSMILLTDRAVRGAPAACAGEPNDALLKWASKYDVKYYLYRPPASPWRALHFKLRRVQQILTGKEDIAENPSWVLYEIGKKGAVKVQLPEGEAEMNRVPGI